MSPSRVVGVSRNNEPGEPDQLTAATDFGTKLRRVEKKKEIDHDGGEGTSRYRATGRKENIASGR